MKTVYYVENRALMVKTKAFMLKAEIAINLPMDIFRDEGRLDVVRGASRKR